MKKKKEKRVKIFNLQGETCEVANVEDEGPDI